MLRALARKYQRYLLMGLLVFGLVGVSAPVAFADGPAVYPDTGNYITTFCLFASGFKPYENIALWIQHPDGSVEPGTITGTGQANAQGKVGRQENDLTAGFACFWGLEDWKDGEYMVVARGLSSGHEVSAPFRYTGQFPSTTAAGIHVEQQYGPAAGTPWFTYTGNGFNPYSLISIWLSAPDGTVFTPLYNPWYSDANGTIHSNVFNAELPAYGEYHLVASDGKHEYWTTFNYIENDANRLNVPSGAGLKFAPEAGPYQSYFIGVGTGFTPYEVVDVWVTGPSGTIVATGVQQANAQGHVTLTYWQAYHGEPLGTYYVTMRGHDSKVQVVGKFTVIDVVPDP